MSVNELEEIMNRDFQIVSSRGSHKRRYGIVFDVPSLENAANGADEFQLARREWRRREFFSNRQGCGNRQQ